MAKFLFLLVCGISLVSQAKVINSSSIGATQRAEQRNRGNVLYCSSSTDCPGSQFCRDIGNGAMICMGNGGQGDWCSSSIDCSGNLFCRDRGDGFKICMGSGRWGDACSSSTDCSGNLFCRDRGDGFKICR